MKIMSGRNTSRQQGAVSLFIVIFTALLVTTITISFMQLMVKDQRQAMYSDLSESAYDSAVAGVEDAKRALLMQQDCIGDSSVRCADINAAISSNECTTLSRIFMSGSSDEAAIIIKEERDRTLEQAYTCVKIKQDTDDYLGTIEADGATLIPLRGTGVFNTVTVSWALSKNGADVTLPSGSDGALPLKDAWRSAGSSEMYAALLRTQLIDGKGGFHLSQFDATDFSNTLFLYPTSGAGLTSFEFSSDGRRSGSAAPQVVRCTAGASSGSYACKATLRLKDPIAALSNTAFLNLMAFYNGTDYKIELSNDDVPVQFANVQPEVDSTGRANDLFRRVVSRIELNNTFNYPVAAIETTGNLCKDFHVTTDADDYKNKCVP